MVARNKTVLNNKESTIIDQIYIESIHKPFKHDRKQKVTLLYSATFIVINSSVDWNMDVASSGMSSLH